MIRLSPAAQIYLDRQPVELSKSFNGTEVTVKGSMALISFFSKLPQATYLEALLPVNLKPDTDKVV